MATVEWLNDQEVLYRRTPLRNHSEWLPGWTAALGYTYFDQAGPRPRDPVLLHGKGDQVRVVAAWESVPSLGELWAAVERDVKERRDAAL